MRIFLLQFFISIAFVVAIVGTPLLCVCAILTSNQYYLVILPLLEHLYHADSHAAFAVPS